MLQKFQMIGKGVNVMVVNEKALVNRMKDAYKNQGYTVAVQDDQMMINSGFWLVQIDMENVPNEVLSLIALHMRLIPEDGTAYKVVKGDDGPFVQNKLISDALGGLEQLFEELKAELLHPGMKKSSLRFDGNSVWQTTVGRTIYLIDPRYEVLISSEAAVSMVGNGIYAEGNTSRAWVLRVAVSGSDADKVQHLAEYRWVQA